MKLKEVFNSFKELSRLDDKAYSMLNESVYEREVGARIWDAASLLRDLYFKQVTGSNKTAYELCKEIKEGPNQYFSDEVGEALDESKTHKECKLRLKMLYMKYKENSDV